MVTVCWNLALGNWNWKWNRSLGNGTTVMEKSHKSPMSYFCSATEACQGAWRCLGKPWCKAPRLGPGLAFSARMKSCLQGDLVASQRSWRADGTSGNQGIPSQPL
ncbi:hypothetical protein E8E14_010180 [Neopestalotiopsis sp. 37M]|nr:hypothetical protein E8E14_010180 [Neopestalotiopsis sp. 37M]